MIAQKKIFLFCVTLFSLSLLASCASDVPAIACDEWDFDCLTNQAVTNINIANQRVEFWSAVNIIGNVSAVVFGIIATLMIALQGDANRHWTRPIGIIAATLVTGISSALINFHVTENIDKLIEIAGQMSENTSEFGRKTSNLIESRNKKEVESSYKNDKVFRKETNRIVSVFVLEQNKLKQEMKKIKGTAAKMEMQKQVIPAE